MFWFKLPGLAGDGPNSLLKYCISFHKQLGMFLRSPCKISSGVMLTNIETPQSLIENIQRFHTHFEPGLAALSLCNHLYHRPLQSPHKTCQVVINM